MVRLTRQGAHRLTPSRVILIVLDSVGVGELPDAHLYGDEGSDTLGNIAAQVPLALPTLRSLGLARVARIGATADDAARGAVGRMAERSAGKDSVTGHWEMMGIVLDRPFPTFTEHGFDPALIAEFSRRVGRGVLGNKAASGTAVIDEYGAEHMRTGDLIVYTSADSVFQIAAHEEIVPLPELYRACEVAYAMFGEGLGVGRVIARPFVGSPGAFVRTSNRHDYALRPFSETLLDRASAAGIEVTTVGKVDDLFAGRGVTGALHSKNDTEGMDHVMALVEARDQRRALIFANLVDFDTQFGHRNDVAGYAANLERFDARLAALLPRLRDSDLLLITADHGNDPTTPSTDHAREYVPVLAYGRGVTPGADIGTRTTFADLGQTLASVFGLSPLTHGTSFLSEIMA